MAVRVRRGPLTCPFGPDSSTFTAACFSPVVLGTCRVMGIPTAPRGGMVSPATSTVVHWQVGTAAEMVIGEFVGLTSFTSTVSFEPGVTIPKSTSFGSP